MSHQGRIVNWKDDQGFGFIAPNDGSPQVFVHVRSFSSKGRRPRDNDQVTYELGTDDQGRPQAVQVVFAGSLWQKAAGLLWGYPAISFAGLFLLGLTVIALLGQWSTWIPGFYLIISLITFAAYALDKSAAQNGKWRTSEQTLLGLGLVGGWPGALVAQSCFRHKTRKRSFQILFWITVTVHCTAFWGLFLR